MQLCTAVLAVFIHSIFNSSSKFRMLSFYAHARLNEQLHCSRGVRLLRILITISLILPRDKKDGKSILIEKVLLISINRKISINIALNCKISDRTGRIWYVGRVGFEVVTGR